MIFCISEFSHHIDRSEILQRRAVFNVFGVARWGNRVRAVTFRTADLAGFTPS
jgi:hypothetical protein